ncbi:hypothetical protein QTP86_027810, partial [Hemibagrus guttatus]
MTATQNTLHQTLMLLPAGGGPTGRWAYVFPSGCARPSPTGKDSATSRSPACPNPRPGSRMGPRGSFCFNYCLNSAWHGDDQFVALLRWYGSPGFFDSGLQLICIFWSLVSHFPLDKV